MRGQVGGSNIQRQECYEGYHGPDEAEDGICPFCNRPMRTGSDAEEQCAMCGMVVNHPEEATSLQASDGRTLYFCCVWCLRVYNREVSRDAYRHIEEASRRARARREEN